jgi:hypothetical protein
LIESKFNLEASRFLSFQLILLLAAVSFLNLFYKYSMVLHKGWDILFFDPGKVKLAKCKVCDAQMDGPTLVEGATSWAESVGRRKHLHEEFVCPYHEEKWHLQVLKLKEYAIGLPSANLEKLVRQEIEEILSTKKPTKEVNIYL